MNRLLAKYQRQPTSKQIGLGVAIIFSVVVTIVSVSMAIQYQNIKYSQQQNPSRFFEAYSLYSLRETAMMTKQLILVLIDSRGSLINSVSQLLIGNSYNNSESIKNASSDIFFSSQQYVQDCQIKTPNDTIFSCLMDIETKFQLQSAWKYQQRRPARRFNIIYQNVQNQYDIMSKSISSNPDFKITNATKIRNKIEQAQSGKLKFTSFYIDQYGTTDQPLVSFFSKLSFPTYNVLIEMETFGSFITTTLTRVLYSNTTNVVMLTINKTQTLGYSIVASFKDLDPLNFTNLLQLGYNEQTLSDGSSYLSYTLPISSTYNLGSRTYLHDTELNSDYVVIVYSQDVTRKMQNQIFGFINQMSWILNEILITFTIVLLMILGLISAKAVLELNRSLKLLVLVLKDFMREGFYNPKIMEAQKMSRISFGPLFRLLNSIIKGIGHKKNIFRKFCNAISNDEYPLNIFQEDFQIEQRCKDINRFQILKDKICSTVKHIQDSCLPTVMQQKGESRADM